MPKILKFLFLFIAIAPIALFLMYQNYNDALDFRVDGKVVSIEWKSKNHQMPLFIILESNTTRTFQSHRIMLTPEQIMVGDYIKKEAGSHYCFVNGNKILCID